MLELPGYKLEKEIGKGGMSTVYLAVHEGLHRRVAIKVMASHLSAEFNFGERFMREARIVANLNHPNIVTVHDVSVYNGYHYIAMEYLPGGVTLDHKIKNGLTPLQSLEIIKQVAAALGYAHGKGIVHRDVKPENIMFREDGTAVLADFGIARSTDVSSKMTSTGTIIGTPHYMSPEQGHGEEIGPRSDIYSLGAVFYETLTGKVPYVAESTIAVILKHVTEPVPTLEGDLAIFQPVLNLMMAKNKDERYQSCSDLIVDLDSLMVHGKASQATLKSHATVIQPSLQRKQTLPSSGASNQKNKTNKFLMAGFAASMLLLVIMAGYFYVSQQQLAQEKAQQEKIRQQVEMEQKLQQLLAAQQAVSQAAENQAQQQAQLEAAKLAELRAVEAQADMARQKQKAAALAAIEAANAKQPALQAANIETLVLTASKQKLPESLHKDLATRFGRDLTNSKLVYPAPCNQRETCLRYAQSLRAKRLIFVTLHTVITEGDMGGVLAELSIDASLLNVENGRQLSGLQNQKGQVVSFDPQNIHWEQAIDRLFADNAAINQLKNTAKK